VERKELLEPATSRTRVYHASASTIKKISSSI
jgi:hypothetical protein